jgi:hypothetical protein
MATATKEKPKKAAAKKEDVLDRLSAMAASSKAYEDELRAQEGGSSNSFITLAQGNTGVLKPDNAAYIKGAQMYDYVISKNKLRLGETLDLTVLGMFKLYTEQAKKQKATDLPKTVAFWLPEDAEQIPLEPGSNFTRQLPNGNTLAPTHWVFVYLHDHPEIDDALLPFQSIGNKVYKDLQKEIAAQSVVSTELRLAVSKQPIESTDHEAWYYPKFEVSGRNYKFEDGKVSLVKGGLSASELAEVLRRSQELHEEYAAKRMVSKKNLAAIVGPAVRPALPAAGYVEEEDEGGVTF